MEIERPLLEVIAELEACLSDLDKLGASVAAAHLSACLDALAAFELADRHLSNMD